MSKKRLRFEVLQEKLVANVKVAFLSALLHGLLERLNTEMSESI